MNEALVENWNKVVKSNDDVYHLGDIALSDTTAAILYIQRLNGKIHWLRGNHDSDNRQLEIVWHCPNIVEFGKWANILKDGKRRIYMSHYPTLTSNYDEKHFSQHVLSLHGHTHQRTNWLDPKNPFLYHVGLDSHNNTPVHIDEVITDIRQRWEEIGRLPVPVQPQDTYPYTSII